MLVGGAIGNVIDRVRDGAVTDFVKMPLGWPAFNVADMSITFGVIVLLSSSSARAMQLRATPEDAGERLDAFLAGPLGSRARAQRLIEDGRCASTARRCPSATG